MPSRYIPGLGPENGAVEGDPGVICEVFTATLAEINAGKTFVPSVGAFKFRPVFAILTAAGVFADLTDIRLSDLAATPVDILTYAVAALADAVLLPNSANVTAGAGFGAWLTPGKGIQIRKTGSTGADGTSVTVILFYQAR